MTIPDDIKRTAEEIVNKIFDDVYHCSLCGGTGDTVAGADGIHHKIGEIVSSPSISVGPCPRCNDENGVKPLFSEAITQALLSSRDQGYQEGVEDAVKVVEKAKCYSNDCSTTCCRHKIMSALSSLKAKLKPKEKSV